MATVPPSIKVAFSQANTLWPARSRASDGTIGDARHASSVSDHNPDSRGIVHAFDLTHDPAHGVDCNVLADLLVKRVMRGAEFRVKLIIWDRRIWNPSRSMTWRPYTGSNPHTKHMHVSILPGAGAENDTSPWWRPIGGTPPTAPVSSEVKPALRRVESLEVDVILSPYEAIIPTTAAGQPNAGCGWVRVPFTKSRIVGPLQPGLRPEVDQRYLIGRVGAAADDRPGDPGTVISVTEWEPGEDAVVSFQVIG